MHVKVNILAVATTAKETIVIRTVLEKQFRLVKCSLISRNEVREEKNPTLAVCSG